MVHPADCKSAHVGSIPTVTSIASPGGLGGIGRRAGSKPRWETVPVRPRQPVPSRPGKRWTLYVARPSLVSMRGRGRSSMVEPQLPKLMTRVRFPSPAPPSRLFGTSSSDVPFRFRSIAQPGSAPRSGRGGRRFDSCCSDQFISIINGLRSWRNGRRAVLRRQWASPSEFDSRRPHQLSERSAARLAHMSGGHGVPSSNLGAPTNIFLFRVGCVSPRGLGGTR